MTAENEGAKIYRAALYLRLSRDESGAYESSSIISQKKLLADYIKEKRDLEIFGVYCDDGYSGVDFDRPDFLRMLADIYEGHVSCVIVKDFSRLGRDYIETGRFIQEIFPKLGVRFIAVADRYDSLYADASQLRLIVPFKNFVNDSYCRDISVKVRAVQRLKRLEGKYTGAFAPYGYRKKPDDKEQLIPDIYPAYIVRKIFILRICGLSLKKIARNLEDSGILPPLAYKRLSDVNYFSGFALHTVPEWTAQTVRRILDDRVYTGVLCQGKTEKVNYKVKQRIYKAQNEQAGRDKTQEAVVGEVQFDIVQELKKRKMRALAGTESTGMFSGILFCGNCGQPMLRRRECYVCGKNNSSGGCSAHKIPEEKLADIVFSQIAGCVGEALTDCNDALIEMKNCDRQISVYESHQKLLERRADWLKGQARESLIDFRAQKIEKWEYDLFKQRFEEEYIYFLNTAEKHKKTIEEMKIKSDGLRRKLSAFNIKEMLYMRERRLLTAAVKKIDIYKEEKIVIYFRFGRGGTK